jgi:hypothetical protein
MPIEIRQTIVTPDVSGSVVQLHISDVAPDDEGATFRLVLLAKLPAFQTPSLAHLQREAMKIAQDALTPLLQRLATDLKAGGQDLNPRRPPERQVEVEDNRWQSIDE